MNAILSLFLATMLCLAVSGCATITGTVTGAFTGIVDAPAETYRNNTYMFEKEPTLFGWDAVIVGPVGFFTGPFFGFIKGASLDVQWVIGKIGYDEVFGTYGCSSIWRPHTIWWSDNCQRQMTWRKRACGCPTSAPCVPSERCGPTGCPRSPGAAGCAGRCRSCRPCR